MTCATRVIRVSATFAASDHLFNEMIFYVSVHRVAALYSRVYVDKNEHRLTYPCLRHFLYLKLFHILLTALEDEGKKGKGSSANNKTFLKTLSWELL